MVKAGDIVQVRVKEVDVARKRIALTMQSGAIERSVQSSASASAGGRGGGGAPRNGPAQATPPRQTGGSGGASPEPGNAFADAFKRAQQTKR